MPCSRHTVPWLRCCTVTPLPLHELASSSLILLSYMLPWSSIDTPGVIHRVSELFKGHNNLILGFNAFLPSGYKIEVVTDYPVTHTATPPVPYGMYGHGAPPPRLSPPPQRPPVRSPLRSSPAHPALAPPRADHAPPEFSHAIDYVTKIKKRFANDPGVYKRFLEILHTYQRQQRSIKDVLEQVWSTALAAPGAPRVCGDQSRDFPYVSLGNRHCGRGVGPRGVVVRVSRGICLAGCGDFPGVCAVRQPP